MQLIYRVIGAILILPALFLSLTGVITVINAWQNEDIAPYASPIPEAIFLLCAGIGLGFASASLLIWPYKARDIFIELKGWLEQLFTGMQ